MTDANLYKLIHFYQQKKSCDQIIFAKREREKKGKKTAFVIKANSVDSKHLQTKF